MTLKRAVDVIGALMAIVVTSPLWVLATVAVKLASRGPVLHRAPRVGRGGVPFTLLKFRTMRADAAISGPGVTAAADPRITRVGSVLRRLKIDELPQLVNVLRGDMSLVGPRPEDPRYVARYTPEQRRVLTVRPGITSPAAVAYRDEERLMEAGPDAEVIYFEKIMPAKLALDLEYVRHRSLWRDLATIAKTVLRLFVRPVR